MFLNFRLFEVGCNLDIRDRNEWFGGRILARKDPGEKFHKGRREFKAYTKYFALFVEIEGWEKNRARWIVFNSGAHGICHCTNECQKTHHFVARYQTQSKKVKTTVISFTTELSLASFVKCDVDGGESKSDIDTEYELYAICAESQTRNLYYTTAKQYSGVRNWYNYKDGQVSRENTPSDTKGITTNARILFYSRVSSKKD